MRATIVADGGHAMCAVDWIVMATEDITNVGLVLLDVHGGMPYFTLGRRPRHPQHDPGC